VEEGSQARLRYKMRSLLPWLLPCALVPVVRIQLCNNGRHAQGYLHLYLQLYRGALLLSPPSLFCCGVQSLQ
jgi:hypothetical protein